jgi:hypothetical protein
LPTGTGLMPGTTLGFLSAIFSSLGVEDISFAFTGLPYYSYLPRLWPPALHVS